MNEGWSVEICVKAGDDGVHVFTVTQDTVLGPFGEKQNGISHASWDNASLTTTTTTEEEATTTTTEEETTTTTEAEVPTTTTEEETTTTVAETTTTIEDEVAGTVITAPTSTVADEVAGTQVEAEELPFTGPETGWLVPAAVLLLISGLMITGLAGNSRED
jgi:hypothetical protein